MRRLFPIVSLACLLTTSGWLGYQIVLGLLAGPDGARRTDYTLAGDPTMSVMLFTGYSFLLLLCLWCLSARAEQHRNKSTDQDYSD